MHAYRGVGRGKHVVPKNKKPNAFEKKRGENLQPLRLRVRGRTPRELSVRRKFEWRGETKVFRQKEPMEAKERFQSILPVSGAAIMKLKRTYCLQIREKKGKPHVLNHFNT